jgi:two-component system, OmpR family, sensor histidine kinase ArlS
MKLYYKLTLINALSRVTIVAAFLIFVPDLIYKAAIQHTDDLLGKRKTEFIHIMNKMGINQFIKEEEDSTYADYTIFKEKYVSIEPIKKAISDTIVTGRRDIEGDTVEARILKHSFKYNNTNYLLEIGESLQYVDDLKLILSKVALYILLGVIFLTVFVDLSVMQYLLRPMQKIEAKLKGISTPEKFDYRLVKTNTTDFRYLDRTIRNMMRKIRNTFYIEKEFIANVSHELLTPVSILQTRLENMLEAGNLDEAAETKIIESQKTLGRLKQIIRSLLLISQIENNQPHKVDKANIPELLNEVKSEIEVRLVEKNISLELDLPDEFEFVPCNRSLLYTLFFNLINNAVKYNKQDGKIIVTGEKTKDEFKVIIYDTGKGIPPENINSIFLRFKKFNNSESDSYGLGLAMVKTIADFHNIDVKVESKLGEGSTFTVVFKLYAKQE